MCMRFGSDDGRYFLATENVQRRQLTPDDESDGQARCEEPPPTLMEFLSGYFRSGIERL